MATRKPGTSKTSKRTTARTAGKASTSRSRTASSPQRGTRAGGAAARSIGNARRLVVVESPAKARTVNRFLGGDYKVLASMGHVRDLPAHRLGVNVEQDFRPFYEAPKDKREVIASIKAAGDRAERIYLATDPDREGEAIAWHVLEAAGWRDKPVSRVVFHSITEDAIREAFEHERDIDMELVNAQQARRIEDRLVGFKLSPLLRPLVGQEINRLARTNASEAREIDVRTLSAGRVQSVALRLVVERDAEISAFVPVEYWSIDASLQPEGAAAFTARLHSRKGERRQIELPNEESANTVLRDLEGAAYAVASVTQREVRERPRPPFITSTLQQEASSRLGFQATRTMTVAQQLYEGVELGPEGPVGLITYMRTDSPQVAPSAVNETRRYIEERWGKDYLPGSPRRYASRSKVAQEAHEAVRPTSIARTPQSVRPHLTSDQARLYELVWNRTVASQMADAVLDRTVVDIDAQSPAAGRPGYVFRATGTVMRFPGFQALYRQEQPEPDDDSEEGESRRALPRLQQGQGLDCRGLTPEQHFTKPPRPFTEATLVRTLEEQGIGRPSTYAATITTIVNRKYVTRERRVLRSTRLGQLVCKQLITHFPDIMDVQFTGRMEDQLDAVANGKQEWIALLREFYDPFNAGLDKAWDAVRAEDAAAASEAPVETCEKCGKPMVIKVGRYGAFLACTGYPDCKNTRDLGEEPAEQDEQDAVEETCEKCGKPMALRRGRFGPFLSCTGYPACKNSRNLGAKQERDSVSVPCPKCGGALVERRSRRGAFYGCSNYPKCNFTVSTRPLAEPCPECEGLLAAAANGGARCTNCAWKGPAPESEPQSPSPAGVP